MKSTPFLNWFFSDNIVSFGGEDESYEESVADVEISRIGSSSSNCQIPDLPTAVYSHSTIHTSTGIISCGGYANSDLTNRCHRLNKTGQWVDFPGMKKGRYYFSMFASNNKLFAVGGRGAENSFESIDLNDATEWRKEKDLPFRVEQHCITRYNETHFLLTGGRLNGWVS